MILAKNLTPFPIARTIPRRVMTAFGMMAGLSMAGPAIAQTTTARPSLPAHNAQTAHFSSKTIEQAGHAMKDVEKIRSRYLPEMQAARKHNDTQKMQKINKIATRAEEQKLAANRISLNKYKEVISAAQTDPRLRERLLKAYASPSTK